MHQLLRNANEGIKEMLEGAGNVKGIPFLGIASAMLLQHQQIWMAEVLGDLVDDDESNSKDLVALVRTQAYQTMEILEKFLTVSDAAEVRQLALQMISRQRAAAKNFEAGQT